MGAAVRKRRLLVLALVMIVGSGLFILGVKLDKERRALAEKISKSIPKIQDIIDNEREAQQEAAPKAKTGTNDWKTDPEEIPEVEAQKIKPGDHNIRIRPNRIPPPKTKEEQENEDPKNPKKFLGSIEEYDSEDLELLKGSKDDGGSEVSIATSHIGNIEHEDILSNDPVRTSKHGTLGVPEKKADIKKIITKAAPAVPLVDEDFSKVKPLKFRIYSHNVKNGGHKVLRPGEESWSDRLGKLSNSIRFNAVPNTILTLQEVYKYQMLDMLDELNRFHSEGDEAEWASYGAGRIDGGEIGEFVPVFWRKGEWNLIFSDTIWLNDKDERKSIPGWDATYLRIMSYVTLQHRATGNYINVLNTHLDHKGAGSRYGSAELILKKMGTINKWPSFLAGDFNSEHLDAAYDTLSKSLADSATMATPFNRYGHYDSTVTGFEGEVLVKGGQNIDYIFAPKYLTKVNRVPRCEGDEKSEEPEHKLFLQLVGFGILHSKFNGVYMSDHRPLVADYYLDKKC